MKVLTLIFVVLGSFQINFAQVCLSEFSNRAFEETITNVLECIRFELNQGIPELEIPHFNPLILQKEFVDMDLFGIDGLSGFIDVEDFELQGLTHFEVTKLKGTIGIIPPSFTLTSSVNFPNLVLKSKYFMDINYEDYHIFGNGIFGFDNNNFSIDLDLKAKISGDVSLSNFNLELKSDPLTSFQLTGFLNDEFYSKTLSDYILNNFPSIISEFSPILNELIREEIMNQSSEIIPENDLITYFTNKCLNLN
nr:uncharacterized protein LOC111417221 [Onthophagus taurus]